MSTVCLFLLMLRLPLRSTRTYTLFPYTTLLRSYMRGEALYGDDLDADGISKWFQEEEPGYYELAQRGSGYEYGYHALNSAHGRSEEHTSELPSLMRNSYAVFCLKKKIKTDTESNRVPDIRTY